MKQLLIVCSSVSLSGSDLTQTSLLHVVPRLRTAGMPSASAFSLLVAWCPPGAGVGRWSAGRQENHRDG